MARKTKMNDLTSPELLAQVNPENQKLKKEFLRYLKSMKRSQGTINGYSHDLDTFFVFLLQECGNKSILQCTIRDFVNFQGHLLEDNENSPARVRRVKASISSFSNAIELLYADEYPNFRNLIRKVESPANAPVREKTVLTQEQIDTLLQELTHRQQYEKACCFALAAYSGRRKAELFRFKVSDFRDENVVYGTLYKSAPINTKGRSGGKKIPCYTLKKQFQPYLDAWMASREQMGLQSEWLFPDPENPSAARDPQIMNSWVRTASSILGVDVYAHSFRHAFVTYLMSLGLPNQVVVSIMQWEKTSGDAMLAIYNDVDDEEDFAKYFKDGDIIGVTDRPTLSDL